VSVLVTLLLNSNFFDTSWVSHHLFLRSVPLSYHYAVKKNYTMWFTGWEQSGLPLRTCVTDAAPRHFDFEDWRSFPLYPANATLGNILIPPPANCIEVGVLPEPFGGKAPKAITVALTASSVFNEYSSLAPFSLVQGMSVEQYAIDNSNSSSVSKTTQSLYLQLRANTVWKLADRGLDLGFCFQSPNKCGVHDALFSHTANADAHSLAMGIGQHQTIDKGDKSKTIKAIVVSYVTRNTGFLGYFNTTFLVGVPPGGYVWAPSPGKNAPITNPWRSVQIFDYYLDQSMLNAMKVPVIGANISTVEFNLVTIDNPAVSVQAGQKVDILLLILNNGSNDLPVNLLPIVDSAAKWKERMGVEALSIAGNADLLARVKAFLA
jgi:hypothetical protein